MAHSRKRFKTKPGARTHIDVGLSDTNVLGLGILPPEIWDSILTLLLVKPSSILPHDLRHKRVEGAPPTPIMQVCKAWYRRAQYIFYTKNEFSFDSVPYMLNRLARMSVESRRLVRSLEVTGIEFWNPRHMGELHMLGRFHSLQYVRMSFHPRSWNSFTSIRLDATQLKVFDVLKDLSFLKKVEVCCPGHRWMNEVRVPRWLSSNSSTSIGTIPTIVKEPVCVPCTRMQTYMNRLMLTLCQDRQKRLLWETRAEQRIRQSL